MSRAFACVLLLLAGCAAAPTGSDGVKQGLAVATPLALEWDPEARLVQVMSGRLMESGGMLVGPDTVGEPPGPLDGEPDAVTYSFQKPTFSQGGAGPGDYYGVTVEDGRVTLHGPQRGITRNAFTFAWHPLGEWRMRAADAVAAAGAPAEPPGWTLWVSAPRNAPNPVWTVQWREGGESHVVMVDDATGRAMTQDAYTAWVGPV